MPFCKIFASLDAKLVAPAYLNLNLPLLAAAILIGQLYCLVLGEVPSEGSIFALSSIGQLNSSKANTLGLFD